MFQTTMAKIAYQGFKVSIPSSRGDVSDLLYLQEEAPTLKVSIPSSRGDVSD